jgi:putative acetyltransferase
VADGTISIADPRSMEVRRLLERHLTFAHAQVPPEDRHALDVDGLTDPSVTFYGLRVDGRLLAVGALKTLDDEHAELKSMHTAEEARRQGLGRSMLDHLLQVARDRGFRRVSIETGAVGAFAPARALYSSAGFAACGPFGSYRASPNTAFMTLELQSRP